MKVSAKLRQIGLGFSWRPGQRWLTLRWRLALWTSGMFVILCSGLLLFVNLTAGGLKPNNLQAVSLIGFGLTTLVSGFGAYWLAGVALRPVREVSQAAQKINPNTLDTRLKLAGPQDELKELAGAFDAMLDRLEQAFEQQRRFTADAAHELRTPLATLRINLEVIAADPQATLADYQAMTATLEGSLTRLEDLVTDLLILATEEGGMAEEAVALGPLLEEILAELALTARSAQVSLHLEDQAEACVLGDSHLLTRIFSNLVENAIRYNRPEGQVKISTCSENEWVLVRVVDTGIGIEDPEQDHIFERFYRVDHSRSRHKGGAGLGLSIVSHLVEQQQGQVELTSSSPNGSIFTVRLPLFPLQL